MNQKTKKTGRNKTCVSNKEHKPKDIIKLELNYSDALLVRSAMELFKMNCLKQLNKRVGYITRSLNKNIKEYFKE